LTTENELTESDASDEQNLTNHLCGICREQQKISGRKFKFGSFESRAVGGQTPSCSGDIQKISLTFLSCQTGQLVAPQGSPLPPVIQFLHFQLPLN
jgi:hypothetical protein